MASSSKIKLTIRFEYNHPISLASLAVGADGFTLFDRRISVVYDGSLSNSKLTQEIIKRGVQKLYICNETTRKRVNDLRKSYPHLMGGKNGRGKKKSKNIMTPTVLTVGPKTVIGGLQSLCFQKRLNIL